MADDHLKVKGHHPEEDISMGLAVVTDLSKIPEEFVPIYKARIMNEIADPDARDHALKFLADRDRKKLDKALWDGFHK